MLWGPGTNTLLALVQTCCGALVQTCCGALSVRQRRRSRRVLLTTEATPYFSVYSIIFEHRRAQITVDDGLQTNTQENAACDDKQEHIAYNDKHESQYTMT